MKPVIGWVLRSRKWSIFWWCVGIASFVALELSVYPSVKSQAKQLNQLLEKLPGTVRSLFGASDLFSPVGYLNSRLYYLLLPLFFSILTIGIGSSLIAKEETDGTLELLLARPISRARLLLSKMFGGLGVIFTIAIVTAIAIIIGVKAVSLPMPAPSIIFATLMAMLLAMLFGMIALAVTCLGGKGRGSAVGLACLVGIGGYIVASLENDVHWLKWPAKIFPYHYYNPSDVLNGHYNWLVVSWLVVGILILGLISWYAFRQRDIRSND